MSSDVLRFGLIGAGFIGRIHGLALQAVNRVFGSQPLKTEAAVLIDSNAGLAEQQAGQLGFAKWATDWQTVIDEIDAIIIAAPSFTHRDVALAAAAGGKHFICEKPVGLSSTEADEIANAALAAGVSTGVGFTYLRTPLIRHAVAIVESGLIGRPVSFRGWHTEDYLADPEAPFTWRLDAKLAGRCGALGDLGWHIISIARALCGPIVSLNGLSKVVHKSRRTSSADVEKRSIENEDWAGMLVRFASGATGTIEVSRVAQGRKMDIGFEVICERGSIAFEGERSNELQLYRHGDPDDQQGFRTIRINGAHPDYASFLPAPAHGLGFSDLKTIELHEFLLAIADGRNLEPGLDEACRISRICEAVLDSSTDGARIDTPEEVRTDKTQPNDAVTA